MSTGVMTITWEDALRAKHWLHRLSDTKPGVAELRDKLDDSVDRKAPGELSVGEVRLCVEASADIEEETLWAKDFVPGKGIIRDETPALSEAERQLSERMKEVLENQGSSQ